MVANSSCTHGNVTAACYNGSSAGLASGLTIFFLLLVIAACFILYKYHGKIRKMFPSRDRINVKKEDYTEAPQAEPHQYSSTTREQPTPAAQTPIYENLAVRTGRPKTKQSRSSGEPEDDLYLQCDVPDDVIYSNDPACNLSLLPEPQEDDVYIMPDVL